jgi:hypothetical protein
MSMSCRSGCLSSAPPGRTQGCWRWVMPLSRPPMRARPRIICRHWKRQPGQAVALLRLTDPPRPRPLSGWWERPLLRQSGRWADGSRGRGLRQCSPVRQANTSWSSQIDQGDDRQDRAAQHFQRSERYSGREQWHSSEREPSRQHAIPKKPVISSARHGHPLHLWASPSESQPTQAGMACNRKNNGTQPFFARSSLAIPKEAGR